MQYNPSQIINTQESSDSISLSSVVDLIWGGKYIILLFMILFGGLGVYYVEEVAVPLYEAEADVVLEEDQGETNPLTAGFFGGFSSMDVLTEQEVLVSRRVVTRLVENMNLIEDPEFNFYLLEDADLEGITPEIILQETITVARDAFYTENEDFSNVIKVIATSTDENKSAALATGLIEAYIEDQLELKFDNLERNTAWLTERAAELKIELEQSQVAIKQFRDDATLINQDTLALLLRQLKAIRSRIEETDQQRGVTETELANLQNAVESKDNNLIAEVSKDGPLAALAERVRTGVVRQADFDRRLRTVLQIKTNAVASVNQQIDSLIKSEAELTERFNKQSDDLIELQQLERDAEANTLLYETFLARLKENTVQRGLQKADASLLSIAVPGKKSFPRSTRTVAALILFGGLFGMLIVFYREMRRDVIETPAEAEAVSGLRVLSSIPMIKSIKRKNMIQYLKEKPTSSLAEAVRNLRTSILMSGGDQAPQIIMPTSSLPGEGKTFHSLSLCQNLSGLDKSVLLIEGDIRRRVFTQHLQQSDVEFGLADVVMHGTEIEDAIYFNEQLGVDVMFSSQTEANAGDVFSAPRFEAMLNELREKYDHIIIDTPPVLVVPDARIIGKYADVVVYVIRWGKTPKTIVRQGLGMLETVGANILGISLSQVAVGGQKGGKYYGYGAYGEYGAKNYYDS